MKNVDYRFLSQTSMFKHNSPEEIEAMMNCLHAQNRHYDKGEFIYLAGQKVQSLGLVLEGSVRIENTDVWGNTSIIGIANKGSVFAETYAAIGTTPLLVDVVAAENCSILFLNVSHILTTCSRTCIYHQNVTSNLLSICAYKNLNLTNKIFHTSPKTIRAKVFAYLSTQAKVNGKSEFDIPFNRQQLAEYLGVDRSALSNELSKMQSEGLIKTHRSHFIICEG